MKRLDNALVTVALGLLVFDVSTMPARAATSKIPSYFRTSDNASASTYAPCHMVPYTPWSNPGNARLGSSALMYYAFDGTPDFVYTNPPAVGTTFATNGGATHSLVLWGADGMVYPVKSGLIPPKPFPAPPASAGLCSFGTFSNACPSANYPGLLAANADWITGSAAEKTYGHYAEDCLGQVPTPVPPPVTGVATPKRTATKLPGACCDANCPAGAPLPRCTTFTPTKARPTATRSPVPPITTAPSVTFVHTIPTATKAPLPPSPVVPVATPTPVSCWFCGCKSK